MSARQAVPTWDPTTLLKIINTDPGYNTITCIGHTARRRCRRRILAGNRNMITELLKEISMLTPKSDVVARKLSTIAGLGLCVYHQGQKESVLMEWMEAIGELEEEEEDDSESTLFGSEGDSSDFSDFDDDDDADDAFKRKHQEFMEKMKENMRAREEHRRQQKQPLREGVKVTKVETSSKEDVRRRSVREEEVREREKKEERSRVEKERKAREARLRRQKEEEEAQRKEQKRKEEQQRKEKEEKQKREDEKAQNERIRLKAEKVKKERLREASEKATKTREEWDQSWATYQRKWGSFRPTIHTRSLKSSIPWPVKSGLYEDVNKENVRLFMTMAGPREENVVKLAKKELLRWHPDKSNVWARSVGLTDKDRVIIEMISVVATDLMNEPGRK